MFTKCNHINFLQRRTRTIAPCIFNCFILFSNMASRRLLWLYVCMTMVVIGVRPLGRCAAYSTPRHIMSVSSCRICWTTFIYWDTGKLDEPSGVRAQSGWSRGGGRRGKEKRSLRRKTIYLRAVTMVHMSCVLLFLFGRDRYIEVSSGRAWRGEIGVVISAYKYLI